MTDNDLSSSPSAKAIGVVNPYAKMKNSTASTSITSPARTAVKNLEPSTSKASSIIVPVPAKTIGVINPYTKIKSSTTSASTTTIVPTTVIKNECSAFNTTSIIAPTSARTASVVNPYARMKKSTSSISTTSIASATESSVPNTASNTAQHFKERAHAEKPPPLSTVDPSSTFSQAFGDEISDADFGDVEHAEQLKFNEALATTDTKADVTPTVPDLTSRENQAFLASHILHVSVRQRGNPVLNYIRNVPFQLSKMVPDYIFSSTRCALFLSIRYHNLHPNYIHKRIAELKSDFDLRVLLCLVDVDDNANVLLFLNDLCVINNFTLILAWSEEEAGRYLETFKAFDGKDATLIQKREHTNYHDQIAHVLGSVRSVNKTDASQLLMQFGTWKNLVGASVEELSVCPGVGVKKVRRLYEAFRRPFTKDGSKRRREREISLKLEYEKQQLEEQQSPGRKKDEDSTNDDEH